MRRLLLTATTVLYLSTSDGLEASTVRQLNLGEMVQRAELIYRGTVLSASAETVEVGGGQLPVTVYRLKVEESFRGEFTEVKGVRIAELRTLGKLKTVRSGDLQSMAVLPRMPELAVGQAYLVLTTRPSAIGSDVSCPSSLSLRTPSPRGPCWRGLRAISPRSASPTTGSTPGGSGP